MTENRAPKNLLIVDDDEPYSAVLERVLQTEGFEVSVANDFRMALDILEGDGPLDLMVADVVMPNGVNGLALSRMARMRRQDLKVIYITGYEIPRLDEQALGPVLKKPVDGARLLGEVRQLLERSRA